MPTLRQGPERGVAGAGWEQSWQLDGGKLWQDRRGRRVGRRLAHLTVSCILVFPLAINWKFWQPRGISSECLVSPSPARNIVLPNVWSKYRALSPAHESFSREQDWAHLIPFYLHDNGARTYQKATIRTMFSAFGAGNGMNRQVAAVRKGPEAATLVHGRHQL